MADCLFFFGISDYLMLQTKSLWGNWERELPFGFSLYGLVSFWESYALWINPFPFHPRLFRRSSSSFSISASASSLSSWSKPKRCNNPWTCIMWGFSQCISYTFSCPHSYETRICKDTALYVILNEIKNLNISSETLIQIQT